MTSLLVLFGFIIIVFGILTLLITAFSAIVNCFLDWWNDIAKQGTIILTTIGITLLITGSLFIYVPLNT